MTIRALIIDDDVFIKDLLQDKLNQYLPEIDVLATASSGTEGIELIRQYRPDLVFLDVEMKDMTGFEMLSQLRTISFQTIFITSHSHYAIKAIRFNALDYILKPFDLEELKQAIRRYKKRYVTNVHHRQIQHALHNISKSDPQDESILLHLQDGEIQLMLRDIIRIEGRRNYSCIYLTRNRKKLCAKTLGEFESLLSDKGFFRCHKSFIVNGLHIESGTQRNKVICSDGVIAPVSRRRMESFDLWQKKQ